MAIKRSQRMDVVVELARRKQDKVAVAVNSQQGILAAEKQRYQDLQDYYQHYNQAFSANISGLRASKFSESRTFLQQMAQAIEGQKRQVAVVEQQLTQVQSEWHKCYLKRQSLEDLQKRYIKEEAADRERLEQRQVEEWITQRSSR
ncbi:flagellar export protein FliJ [Teredinibacter haidensis]|uniref:flagellar export protein FliJ n=1 Tax=Teredinibacter haidensis TaxID=2731755 RepID=UPI0009491AB1|nr:flagellar export protein FliJ [Teredinibacter haidensis]